MEPGVGSSAASSSATEGAPAQSLLEELARRSRERFEERKQILSFGEWLGQLLEDPRLHTRNAALYMRDMLEFFGTEEVWTTRGRMRRYKLFDAPFNGGASHVFGQETVQNELMKHLVAFCERGGIDKLLMVHGPNGSAKSTFVECLAGGLEDYSQRPEGVLYRFNWIFSDAQDRAALGFHERASGREDGSLAYLGPDDVTFKLGCELKDHPLLLIPLEDRRRVLEDAFARASQRWRVPRALESGDLCPKCKEIQRALLNAYQGDWRRVVEHVQVERLYVSARYRRAAVTIQPQRNVDAASRPLNLEKSYRLPPILSQSNLTELSGDLVDANRGLAEYSDFFKRPIEINKYLLTTSERATISLPDATAHLDCVLLATCNEKNLTIFKRNPDFPSFKARFELIRAPYLLRWSVEEEIYKRSIRQVAGDKHVAPHVTRVIALWAVLTRLRRPRSSHYKGELASLVTRLRPLDKARLYDRGEAPEEWPDAERRELVRHLDQIAGEWDYVEEEFEGIIDAGYEGRRGASPREIMIFLHEAAQDPTFPCLSPLAALKVVRRVATDKSLFEFLRLEAEAGYCDVDRLTDDVEGEWRRLVRDEVHRALALVEESAYEQLFEDYFKHVKAFDSGEKVQNRHTKRLEPPSDDLMKRVEKMVGLGGAEPARYRKNLIMRIAAWVIDHPGKEVAYQAIFGDIFQALRAHYHKEREVAITQFQGQLLRYGTDDWVTVSAADQKRVVDAFSRLKTYGYCDACAREALNYVLRHKGED